MIDFLRCENFRCFKDTNIIKLAPLTLLFGENNSGKSAILQALHLPSLTLQREDKQTPLALASEEYDYGSFSDVVFGHDEKKRIVFSYGFSPTSNSKKTRLYVLQLEYGYLPKRREIYLHSFTIKDSQGEKLKILQNKYTDSIKSIYVRNCKEDLTHFSRLYSRVNFLFDLRYAPTEILTRLERKYSKKTIKTLFMEIWDNLAITDVFKFAFMNIQYVGPLRAPARRTLLYEGSSFTRKVGYKGERTLQSYSALLRRGKKEDKETLNLINTALYRLGFIKRFEKLPVGPRHHEFWTQHSMSLLRANLADSGFGTSQILPVLFTLYAAQIESILLYEQPELHLHPAAQLELGSIFAEECLRKKKKIVIETHSENLILRIQTELARRKLSPRDVAVYYIQPKKDGHIVIPLPINERGVFIQKWPRGFFEEGYRESLELVNERRAK